jgi:nucleotide-binding universal stress UspA family protein
MTRTTPFGRSSGGASLAEKYGAQLLLLHVIPGASEELPELWDAYSAGRPAPSPLLREEAIPIDLIEVAQNDLKDFAMANLNESRPVGLKVGVGRPAEEILRLAQDEGVNLIAMGTHGRTGLHHVLMGSIAETVMRGAPCPVLTVKAAAQVAP